MTFSKQVARKKYAMKYNYNDSADQLTYHYKFGPSPIIDYEYRVGQTGCDFYL